MKHVCKDQVAERAEQRTKLLSNVINLIMSIWLYKMKEEEKLGHSCNIILGQVTLS